MVPFVLCNTYKCSRASECYRLRVSPDIDQPYENFSKLCNEDNNHNFFMKIRSEDKVLDLDKILKNNKELEKLPENKCLEIGIPEA